MKVTKRSLELMVNYAKIEYEDYKSELKNNQIDDSYEELKEYLKEKYKFYISLYNLNYFTYKDKCNWDVVDIFTSSSFDQIKVHQMLEAINEIDEDDEF